MCMAYSQRLKFGAVLGLIGAALLGSALIRDNIPAVALLLYPAGVAVGLVIAHLTSGVRLTRTHP